VGEQQNISEIFGLFRTFWDSFLFLGYFRIFWGHGNPETAAGFI